jgi:hypothetical protein
MLKICIICKEEKDIGEFYKSIRYKSGYLRRCKKCSINAVRRSRAKKLEYYQRQDTLSRQKSRLASYGLKPNEYDTMVLKQQNLCGICSNPSERKNLAVDHDHETGEIRGLLCISCNAGLGFFKDNPNILEKALVYLSQFKPLCRSGRV